MAVVVTAKRSKRRRNMRLATLYCLDAQRRRRFSHSLALDRVDLRLAATERRLEVCRAPGRRPRRRGTGRTVALNRRARRASDVTAGYLRLMAVIGGRYGCDPSPS